mmetsp:Transcript_22334/g.31226  ORF Transcript_22334/g.31226 Transcript_22334/m.31226 type:complete len:258 (+) Transcript_22334:1258-2031(+)
MRAFSKNMCSVRVRPMPSAPRERATRASFGVSAFASTPSLRKESAYARRVPTPPFTSGFTTGSFSRYTLPVAPSREIQSPYRMVFPLMTALLVAPCLISRSEQPDTQHLFMPLATTAAWEVIPPRAVRVPSEASIPPMSSGEVSRRTSTHALPSAFHLAASSEVKTICPTAAPGEAGSPFATCRAVLMALGSSWSWSSFSIWSGLTRRTAVFLSIRPSCTISTAMRTAALAVRFPFRVCRIQSLLFWMVNSMSCMSW